MQYVERSAEAVRRCVNERAALQSWAWVLTGLLPEQPRQLKHGWTHYVIETPLARTSWRRHRALRGHPETFSYQESKLTGVMLVTRGKVCVNNRIMQCEAGHFLCWSCSLKPESQGNRFRISRDPFVARAHGMAAYLKTVFG